jgi:hypothetical protein
MSKHPAWFLSLVGLSIGSYALAQGLYALAIICVLFCGGVALWSYTREALPLWMFALSLLATGALAIATVALMIFAPSGPPEEKGTSKGEPKKEEAPENPGFPEKQGAPKGSQQ